MWPMWDITDHAAKAVGKSKQPVLSSVTVPSSSPMTDSLQSVWTNHKAQTWSTASSRSIWTMTQCLSFCLYIPLQWIKQSRCETFIFILSGFSKIWNLLIRSYSHFLESISIFSCSKVFGHMTDQQLNDQAWSVLSLCQDKWSRLKVWCWFQVFPMCTGGIWQLFGAINTK